jgi:hypothetical protein
LCDGVVNPLHGLSVTFVRFDDNRETTRCATRLGLICRCRRFVGHTAPGLKGQTA